MGSPTWDDRSSYTVPVRATGAFGDAATASPRTKLSESAVSVMWTVDGDEVAGDEARRSTPLCTPELTYAPPPKDVTDSSSESCSPDHPHPSPPARQSAAAARHRSPPPPVCASPHPGGPGGREQHTEMQVSMLAASGSTRRPDTIESGSKGKWGRSPLQVPEAIVCLGTSDRSVPADSPTSDAREAALLTAAPFLTPSPEAAASDVNTAAAWSALELPPSVAAAPHTVPVVRPLIAVSALELPPTVEKAVHTHIETAGTHAAPEVEAVCTPDTTTAAASPVEAESSQQWHTEPHSCERTESGNTLSQRADSFPRVVRISATDCLPAPPPPPPSPVPSEQQPPIFDGPPPLVRRADSSTYDRSPTDAQGSPPRTSDRRPAAAAGPPALLEGGDVCGLPPALVDGVTGSAPPDRCLSCGRGDGSPGRCRTGSLPQRGGYSSASGHSPPPERGSPPPERGSPPPLVHIGAPPELVPAGSDAAAPDPPPRQSSAAGATPPPTRSGSAQACASPTPHSRSCRRHVQSSSQLPARSPTASEAAWQRAAPRRSAAASDAAPQPPPADGRVGIEDLWRTLERVEQALERVEQPELHPPAGAAGVSVERRRATTRRAQQGWR